MDDTDNINDRKEDVILHLSNDITFTAFYFEGEYDEIYDAWHKGGEAVLAFENCCIKAKDVIMIEYK